MLGEVWLADPQRFALYLRPSEMHAAALYQRMGEDLLRAAPGNADVRSRVVNILGDLMSPRRLERTQHALLQPAVPTDRRAQTLDFAGDPVLVGGGAVDSAVLELPEAAVVLEDVEQARRDFDAPARKR